MHVRVVDGQVSAGDRLQLMATSDEFEATSVGAFLPKMTLAQSLVAGDIGFVAAGIKSLAGVRIGDTLTEAANPAREPLIGFPEVKPMVFAGLYPSANADAKTVHSAIEKLALNDAALEVQAEVSESLGAGFRCGFLGVLHMEIVKERLEREFGVAVITTAPSVIYHAYLKNKACLQVANPSKMPGEDILDYVEEPYVRAKIHVPDTFIGSVMELCTSKRGMLIDLEYADARESVLVYELPLADMAFDFFNVLKSLTHGYATLDYTFSAYRRTDLVRVDVLLDEQLIDAFSFIIHRDLAYPKAAELVKKLKYVIPRKLYPVPVQAAIGHRVIAREDIPPLRKSALARGFQGGVSQKNRLIRKQKEGRRIRSGGLARNDIPQEAFLAILSLR